MASPFTYSFEPIANNLLAIEYVGYMDEGAMEPIRRTSEFLDSATSLVGLAYTVRDFVGFHRSLIPAHAELFLPRQDKILGIAVVAARPAIHFAAITVGLMAKTPLKSFTTREEGISWLRTLDRRSTVRA